MRRKLVPGLIVIAVVIVIAVLAHVFNLAGLARSVHGG
jgi:hypothetical protein